MVLKEYKKENKTICHIAKITMGPRDLYFVRTGSPKSDRCLVWKYENLADAEKTAQEYFENVINF